MSSARPATVRVYFDADVLGLARLLCQERADFTYPGDPGGRIKRRLRPQCPISSPAARDSEWIPAVAARGWLIITRDRNIQRRPAQLDAVRLHRAKMINLAGAETIGTWAQLEVFMSHWREIEELIDQPGPFIYIATRSGRLRAVDLTA